MRATSATATQADLEDLADWHRKVRSQFPQIVTSSQAYLDSSATSQKPQAVLDAVQHYLTTSNANPGRGSYQWANQSSALLEEGRRTVRQVLHDPAPQQSTVTFVSGASEGLRRVARDWLASTLRDGDEIVVPVSDHQANVVAWHDVVAELAAAGTRVVAHPMPYEPSGDYDTAALAQIVNRRTRFIAVTHVHHVYGVDMNVHRIREVVGPEPVLCLDAAQSIGHLDLSVADLDADFVVFSGHKAMALPGVGVVWSRNLRTSPWTCSGWAGSPNTAGVVSLTAALRWLDQTGLQAIDRWTTALTALLTQALSELASIEVVGCQTSLRLDSPVQRRQGIVTFRRRGIPAGDLGFYLESCGLLVRADHLCQAGAGPEPSVRVSTHAYTSRDEIQRLIDVLTRLEKERPWSA
ncbi:MAG: aminotransferase class V-fold PLP-dependent enzyme [Actinomycetia bacterium]|nr:aminotransferase class V-fold PLP-dependent enzyme [Actinomycetes bacterium]